MASNDTQTQWPSESYESPKRQPRQGLKRVHPSAPVPEGPVMFEKTLMTRSEAALLEQVLQGIPEEMFGWQDIDLGLTQDMVL